MNLIRDTFKNKLRMWLNKYKIVKQMKNQSNFGWNEESYMSLIVGNDFAKGVGARTTTRLERDISDVVEEVAKVVVGLDVDDGVEEICGDEEIPKTPVQSRTNGIATNPFEKSTSAMLSRKKKKTMVDTVESIGVAVKAIGTTMVELRKPAANPHI
ncbi:hypothetical protein AMTRI_Chr08g163230 [Amborella trichopoda]